MLCASDVRGIMSSAIVISFFAAVAFTKSALESGYWRLTSAVPSFSFASSLSLGRITLMIASLFAMRSSNDDAICAPAAWYSASENDDAMPAPVSTRVSIFLAASFFTVSGMSATRFSPGAVSLGIPILMLSSRCSPCLPRFAILYSLISQRAL